MPGEGDRVLHPGIRRAAAPSEPAATASTNGSPVSDEAREIPAPRRRPPAVMLAALGVAALGAAAGLTTPGVLIPVARRVHDDWLALRTIAVSGATARVPSDEIAAATGIAPGTSLLDIDAAAAETRLRTHPWVLHARVVRVPPHTLVVSVRLREPVASVAGLDPGLRWLVDAGGHAFAPANEQEATRLPVLAPAVVDPPEVGATALADGAAVAEALSRSRLVRPAEIVIGARGDPEGVRLRLEGLPADVLLGWRDFDARLASLARLLAAEIPGLAAASAIDLRFADRAVLRGLPSPEAAAQRAVTPGGAGPPPDRRG